METPPPRPKCVCLSLVKKHTFLEKLRTLPLTDEQRLSVTTALDAVFPIKSKK